MESVKEFSARRLCIVRVGQGAIPGGGSATQGSGSPATGQVWAAGGTGTYGGNSTPKRQLFILFLCCALHGHLRATEAPVLQAAPEPTVTASQEGKGCAVSQLQAHERQ